LSSDLGSLPSFLHLVGRIYDAAASPGEWPDLLASLAEWAGAGPTALLMPTLWRQAEGLAFLELVTGAVFEAAEPSTLLRDLTARRRDADPPFRPEEAERLSPLLPHMTRALAIMIRLEEKERLLETTEAALERIPQAVALLGSGGEVHYANPPAERILAAEHGISLRRQAGAPVPYLHVDDPAVRERVAARIRDAACGAGREPSRSFEGATVPRASGGCPLVIRFTPLGKGAAFLEGFRKARVLAILTDPGAPTEVDQAFLVSTFGLTAAEGRAVDGLHRGDALADLARLLNVTLNTLKTQEKEIFAKLGVDSRAAMTAFLGRLDVIRSKAAAGGGLDAESLPG